VISTGEYRIVRQGSQSQPETQPPGVRELASLSLTGYLRQTFDPPQTGKPTLMFWLKIVKDFISILREGQTPAQIAGGFALGSFLGFSPMFTLQGLLVWLIVLVLDVNLSAALLSLTLCSLLAYILDPVFHTLGFALLVQVDALHGLWTWMYNVPIAPLTRFNNTVVMGSLAFAFVCFVPLFVGMKRFVVAYRTHVGSRIEKWKVYQIIKQSTLIQWYTKIRSLGG
jgi:uncharacterized protein (TIGR03546 family)